jgi:hypothetical protein
MILLVVYAGRMEAGFDEQQNKASSIQPLMSRPFFLFFRV